MLKRTNIKTSCSSYATDAVMRLKHAQYAIKTKQTMEYYAAHAS